MTNSILTPNLTPAQCFAARQILGLTRKALAARLSVPADAVRAFEVEGRGLDETDLRKAREILEASSVQFADESDKVVRLRKEKGHLGQKRRTDECIRR